MSKFYSKLTAEDLVKALNEIYNRKVERQNSFVIYCNSKMAQVFDITNKEYLGLISPERAALERNAAINNAYIHPEWDYLKYPQIYILIIHIEIIILMKYLRRKKMIMGIIN